MPQIRRNVSLNGRRYYVGNILTGIGVLLFVSVFITGAMNRPSMILMDRQVRACAHQRCADALGQMVA
jgi:hypothetical protein